MTEEETKPENKNEACSILRRFGKIHLLVKSVKYQLESLSGNDLDEVREELSGMNGTFWSIDAVHDLIKIQTILSQENRWAPHKYIHIEELHECCQNMGCSERRNDPDEECDE